MNNIFQLVSVLASWSKTVRNSRAIIILATAAGAVAGLGSTALIAIINRVLAHGPSRQSVIGFAVLCGLIPLAGFISQTMLVRLTARAAHDLRLRLSGQILAAPYRVLEEIGIARLLATITEDIPAVTTAVTSLPLLGTQLAIMLGCLAYLGWLSWPLLLVVLGYMVLGIISHQIPMIRTVRYFRLMRGEWDATFKGIRALTEGTKELKLNRERRDAFIALQLKPAIDGVEHYGVIANTIAAAATNWGQILFFIFIGLILFVTPLLMAVSQQSLVGYTLTVLFMIAPLSIILNTMPTLGRAQVAAEKVKALGLSLTNVPAEAVNSGQLAGKSWRQLDFAGVTHVYRQENGEEFSVGPLHLSFTPGEVVFLIGGNGSGKTTLAKLLIGLYEPEMGNIYLDGTPITLANRDDYRQNFSVVFYDFYLFDRLFGVKKRDLESKSREYLVQLQLDHKVSIDEDKLSTTDLSQGQRKRLALLASYLEDRPIYVFDEWASDQDPAFKEVFYRRIVPELKARGKSVIVISHDDHYYNLADRIIKMERGQIEYDKRLSVATGPEEALSARAI
jgi:putative ATP-binding cassette transporter